MKNKILKLRDETGSCYRISTGSITKFWARDDGLSVVCLVGLDGTTCVREPTEHLACLMEEAGEQVLFIPDSGTGFWVSARHVSLFMEVPGGITSIYHRTGFIAGDILISDFESWLNKAWEA